MLEPPESTSDSVDGSYFENIRLSNGVFRTTTSRRLDDVNASATQFIKAYRSPRILDVAASSGVSSAEWSEALLQAGVEHRLTVTDLVMWGSWLRWMGITLLYEPGDNPHLLQVDIGGLALPNSSGSFWRNRIFRLANVLLPHKLMARRAQPVMLVGPAIRRHAAAHKHISFAQLNIFDMPTNPEGTPYQVIRAANVLNKGYFSDAQLMAGLRNLLAVLDDGGLLILVRTLGDGSNHGSLHIRSRGRFDRAATIGSGYESDALLAHLSAAK